MWLNRVSNTVEDYRLLHALPKFLEALREMSPVAWRSCLHVSTSPVPRALGEVDDAILDKGLGPIGDFPLPKTCGIPWCRNSTRMACGGSVPRKDGRMGIGW